jgi:hypothetical protein
MNAATVEPEGLATDLRNTTARLPALATHGRRLVAIEGERDPRHRGADGDRRPAAAGLRSSRRQWRGFRMTQSGSTGVEVAVRLTDPRHANATKAAIVERFPDRLSEVIVRYARVAHRS